MNPLVPITKMRIPIDKWLNKKLKEIENEQNNAIKNNM